MSSNLKEPSEKTQKSLKLKRNPPTIKQTLTSKMRSERYQLEYHQNQLLQLQSKLTASKSSSLKIKAVDNLNASSKISLVGPNNVQKIDKKKQVTSVIKSSLYNNKSPRPTTNGINVNGKIPKINNEKAKNSDNFTKPNLTNSKPSILPNRQNTNFVTRNISAAFKKKPDTKKNVPHTFVPKSAESSRRSTSNESQPNKLRKSLTSLHFKKVKNFNPNEAIKRTHSWADVSAEDSYLQVLSPIVEQSPGFKTPLAQRRSVAFYTPLASAKTPSASPQDLKQRLASWLDRRGKSLSSFSHLHCFGMRLSPILDEENKENVEVASELNQSFEDLAIVPKKNEEISVAKDAVHDLHTLILEGYDREECEKWLDKIKSKCSKVDEFAHYWECKAAIEESRGDITNAIDCYQTAIVKGAKVNDVDESLENLLQKFSILNITPTKKTVQKKKNILDARNIFKSTIINFAVQKRNLKINQDDQPTFIATPVRRSTRVTRSHYVSTPGVQIYASLDKLESPVRKSLNFKCNTALK